MGGPLSGFTIVELGGIGPGPYCGMLLGDLGADVIRIERPAPQAHPQGRNTPHFRNRRSLALNFKSPKAIDILLRLIERADACFEGFRPGVAERLGIGPDACMARNPRLVYGRITGWGQDGPLAQAPGHDINYIALTGALHAIGPRGGKPVPPLNLIGDFAGGGMFLALGLVAALLEAQRSGRGQVVDAAMVDGVASLMAAYIGYRNLGFFRDEGPGASPLGGAAPYYDTYEVKDGKFICIASIEPKFYDALIRLLDLDRPMFAPAMAALERGVGDDPSWPRLKAELVRIFKTRTQDEWCVLLEGSDVCFAPVLSLSDAPGHPHNQARSAYVEVGGSLQNAPGPRFSRTNLSIPAPAPDEGADTDAILRSLGVSAEEAQALRAADALL